MTGAVDRIEALYDWRHALGGTNKEYMPFARADVDLLQTLLNISTAKVCDVGCGQGAHLRALLESGARFPVGIDLSGRALEGLLDGGDVERIVLIRGDVTLWQMRQAFDALICSLPPLAHEGSMSLNGLTRVLHALLKQHGVLLLKLFTLESIPSIVGSYAVHYEGATATSYSNVKHEEYCRSVVIEQYSGDETDDKWIEELALPSRDDVRVALERAGFQLQEIIDHTAASLPGTEIFLARV